MPSIKVCSTNFEVQMDNRASNTFLQFPGFKAPFIGALRFLSLDLFHYYKILIKTSLISSATYEPFTVSFSQHPNINFSRVNFSVNLNELWFLLWWFSAAKDFYDSVLCFMLLFFSFFKQIVEHFSSSDASIWNISIVPAPQQHKNNWKIYGRFFISRKILLKHSTSNWVELF